MSYSTLRELQKQTPAFVTAANTAAGQFQLTAQQLEYTQRGDVKLSANLGFAPVGDTLFLRLTNIGHETASKIRLSLDVRKRWTKSESVEGNVEHFTVTPKYDLVAVQEVMPMGEPTNTDMAQRPVHISAKEEDQFREANLFFEATGTLEYFNGFHDVSYPICLRNISFARRDRRNNSPGGDLVNCGENFEAQKEIVFRSKRAYTPPP